MSEKRTSLEVIAPSVEDAVAKGLADLGLSEDEVEVEVLDSGSKGLFGLGFRQARVRLTIKGGPQEAPAVIDAPAEADAPAASLAPTAVAVAPEQAALPKPARPSRPVVQQAPLTEEQEQLLRVARETVEELLDKMKIKATVTASFGEPDDEQDRAPLLLDIRGGDLSILIGPKAETLNALQYIAGLIVGKEVGHSIPLVIDVEDFRFRRTQQIRQLARRMAEQAVRTGRRQVLEPMPANERRLVHIELRDHPQVTTESVGEDPRRKVTIIPKP
ncbi:MAG: RNA-binding cell elongation regulator Jag/EloR [Chloroflexota bacterium]